MYRLKSKVCLLVGVRRLELPTSTSRTWRAANCATPRLAFRVQIYKLFFILHCFFRFFYFLRGRGGFLGLALDFFTFDKPAPLWGLFFFRELFLLWRAFLLWRQPPGDKLFADWGPVGVMAIGREVDGGVGIFIWGIGFYCVTLRGEKERWINLAACNHQKKC